MTAEPVEHNGQRGFWAQGDCAFIPTTDPVTACNEYRKRLSEAKIGISTHRPDGIRVRELYAENAQLREQLQETEQKRKNCVDTVLEMLGGACVVHKDLPWKEFAQLAFPPVCMCCAREAVNNYRSARMRIGLLACYLPPPLPPWPRSLEPGPFWDVQKAEGPPEDDAQIMREYVRNMRSLREEIGKALSAMPADDLALFAVARQIAERLEALGRDEDVGLIAEARRLGLLSEAGKD